jgi:hypothetical protein
MFGISRILDTGRASVQYVFSWRRRISSRNGTDDARRARARRLFMMQSCAGPPIGGYPCGVAQASVKQFIQDYEQNAHDPGTNNRRTST